MQLYEEAKKFIMTCYDELGKSLDETTYRLTLIKDAIEREGTYELTYEELEHGARMAWRNNNRCIGRLFWQSLKVFDERKLLTTNDIASALYRHIEYATNFGRIRPTITVFHSKVRVWNHQLIRYAGYESELCVIGDPQSVPFTRVCEDLGWKGKGTPFDVLPLVIQVNEEPPQWFSIPESLVLEINIIHPDIPSFQSLGLKWYSVPMIADMTLDIGGLIFQAAPFNGWYMETEIGARNLADSNRYNMLPKVASLLCLNMKTEASLWKDRALLELNTAVLYSFKEQGVMIVDHHTAAKQFERFEQMEKDEERKVTGDWTWLIPPVSPATTHIFHSHYDNVVVKPNYFSQKNPY